LRLRRWNRDEVSVGDWIFILLAKEMFLGQHIHGRRRRVRVLSLVQSNRVRVLQPSKDQFIFLFALRSLPPDGHDHRHQNGHHAQCDEQRRHRVAAL
jgi:hypothetical protein